MNYAEAPRDDAEVLRLLREEDSLGAESSLWLRAFRQLTQEAKPIGQLFCFTIPVGDDKKMPIGLLTLTENNRLVFWPVLPRNKSVVINKPGMELPDHVTVQFPSEKAHVTSYDSEGGPIHKGDAWRSTPVEEPDLRLLFTFLVRMSVMVDQDVIVSRKFPMPQSDRARRSAEFAGCANSVFNFDLPLPGNALEKQYAGFFLYCCSKVLTVDTLPKSLLPISAIKEMVVDWPDNSDFPITVTQFKIREQMFCLAAGFPPGRLKDELCFGLPRRRQNSRGQEQG